MQDIHKTRTTSTGHDPIVVELGGGFLSPRDERDTGTDLGESSGGESGGGGSDGGGNCVGENGGGDNCLGESGGGGSSGGVRGEDPWPREKPPSGAKFHHHEDDVLTPEKHPSPPDQRGHSPQPAAPTTTDAENTVPQPANLTPTDSNEECSLCLLDFEVGDTVRHLPCRHHFHQKCIDRWLIGGARRTCPLCKADPLASHPVLTPSWGRNRTEDHHGAVTVTATLLEVVVAAP